MNKARRETEIGAWLRKVRKNQGWTQAELAWAAGMSATALSKIETGKKRPDVTTVRTLLRVTGFSPDAARLIEVLRKDHFK
jgi:transcriptional regulator with XRE-family HTH domain